MLQWFAPVNGDSLTDISLHYVFQAAENAVSYRLCCSRDESFTDVLTFEFDQHPGCTSAYFLPEDDELLPAGEWFIRAIADTGEETELLHIYVNDLHTKAPLRTEISPTHPLVTIFDHSKHDFGAEYDVLPEDLKEYFAIMGGAGWASDINEKYDGCMSCDAKGYPWIMHIFSHGEVINGRYIVTPLPIAEKVLANAKNVRAVVGLEIYMGVRPDGDWVNTIYRRVIMLCGKYGLPFLHTDGNRNDIDLASVIRRPVFTEVLREYHEYVIFSYKQNHANTSYSCYGAILGAWMDGLCDHLGIQAENWYWNDAGFCDDIGGYHGYLQGNEQQTPAVFTSQMLLPGLSLGADYYSLEGEGWLIQMRGNDTYEYSPQGTAVLSMLRSIIHRSLIPSREEVLSQVRAVVDAEGWGKDWGDAWTGGVFRTAFQNLYGIIHTKELFPKQLRYFYLPFATEHPEHFTDAGLRLISADKLETPDQMNELLNPLYPAWFEGDAYVTRTGGTYVIMNSRENTYESQYYRVPLAGPSGLCTEVSGAIGLWQYMIIKNIDNCTYIELNARKGSRMTASFAVKPDAAPALLSGGDHVTGSYDASTGRFNVTIEGNDVPAECIIYDTVEAAVAACCAAADDAACCAADDETGKTTEAVLAAPEAPLVNTPFTETFLSDMTPTAVSGTGKGLPTVDHMANLRYGILPLSMNAIRYPHGFCMPMESRISYDLGGRYASLSFTLGFDIDAWMPIIVNHTDIVWDRYEKDINVVVRIYGDDTLLYESESLTSTFYKAPVTLDVTGVHTLRFEADGDIIQKPLWCAITGTPDRYLFDASARDDIPPAEVYIDIGNPVLK